MASPAPQAQREHRLDRSTAWILLAGGALGLLAAAELTIEKFRVLSDPDYVPSCDINPVLSCGSIIVTPQAEAFGFPNPLLGLIGFTVVITIGVILLAGATLPRWIWLGLNIGSLAGIGFVLWLVWQSLYSIGALCPWCMVVWSVVAPIVIWVTSANLASERIPTPEAWRTAVIALVGLRIPLAIAWYVVLAGLIFVRWQSYWLQTV